MYATSYNWEYHIKTILLEEQTEDELWKPSASPGQQIFFKKKQ